MELKLSGPARLIEILKTSSASEFPLVEKGGRSELEVAASCTDVLSDVLVEGQAAELDQNSLWLQVVELAEAQESTQIGQMLRVAGLMGSRRFRDAVAYAEKLAQDWKSLTGSGEHPVDYLFLWIGRSYRALGQFRDAEQAFREALTLARTRRHPVVLERASLGIARLRIARSEFRLMIRELEPVVVSASRKSFVAEASRCLLEAYGALGEYITALTWGQSCLEIWHDADSSPKRAWVLNQMALVHGERGDHIEAVRCIAESIRLNTSSESANPIDLAISMHNLAHAQFDLDLLTEAESSFGEAGALLLSSGRGSSIEYVRVLCGLGELQLEIGEAAKALATADRAESLAETIGSAARKDVAHALIVRASALWELGKTREASIARDRARSIDSEFSR